MNCLTLDRSIHFLYRMYHRDSDKMVFIDDFEGCAERPQYRALSANHRVIGGEHRTLKVGRGVIQVRRGTLSRRHGAIRAPYEAVSAKSGAIRTEHEASSVACRVIGERGGTLKVLSAERSATSTGR
jgi:hypothetical protein